jgi:hypothetical protein
MFANIHIKGSEGDLLLCATVADLEILEVSEYPFDMSRNPKPVTQCHILDDLNPVEKLMWELQISMT